MFKEAMRVIVTAQYSSFSGQRGWIVRPAPPERGLNHHWIVQLDTCPVQMLFGERELERETLAAKV